MIREILFRGKRKANGKWVYGYYWYIEEHHEERLSKRHFIKSINNGIDYEVFPETVGQYTGLTDKNGTKIFEGDIVKYSIYPPNEFEYGVVNWNHGGFRAGEQSCNLCVCSADGVSEYSLTVIGNIHDNPQLLKEGVENG